MATLTEYEGLVNGVADYFNTDAASVWSMINQQNINPSQLIDLLPTTDKFLYGNGYNSGYTAVQYANGDIATWNNVAPLQMGGANGVAGALDSNSGDAITQTMVQMPADTNFSGSGGSFKGSKGLSSGISGVLNVGAVVSTAVAGLGMGIRLGKAVESTIYNFDPDFWDNIGLSTLNPDTWDSLTVNMSDTGWEGTLKRGINAILGINPSTGNSQLYIDQNMAAYLAMYMNGRHFFDEGETTYLPDSFITDNFRGWTFDCYGGVPSYTYQNHVYTFTGSYTVGGLLDIGNGRFSAIFVSESPFSMTTVQDGSPWSTSNASIQVMNGKTFYTVLPGAAPTFDSPHTGTISVIKNSNNTILNRPDLWGYCVLYGTPQGGQAIDGVSTQTGATTPNFNGCTTLADYLNALRSQFPDMFNNSISQDVAQPDGTVKHNTYVPIGTATSTGTQDTQGTTNENTTGQSQSDTAVNPSQADSTLLQTLVNLLTNTRSSTPDGTRTDTPNNPPDTGNGDTPTVVVPTGQASALWSVYNPSQAQLNSFGAWLWSSSFIDQVLKLFNNPMQSIIGVHKIFATPATSGAGSITVGYLDSGVSANLVSNQYTDIDCGTVKVGEQFGNVFDYTDTHIRLYLPFIGIVDLDTADVMRGSVKVVYHVDVITGACLADVLVTRDNSGGVLYQFAGDAAVRYPISSGSYIGVVSGIASAIGGVASAVMTGGATLPLAAGAIAGGIGSAKTNVQHSGNFSGNAGAMGAKKPYLIIERPQAMIADDFGNYQGKGANVRRTVAQMSGYFKFSDVHTESISGAAESEIEAIRAALESGVIA